MLFDIVVCGSKSPFSENVSNRFDRLIRMVFETTGSLPVPGDLLEVFDESCSVYDDRRYYAIESRSFDLEDGCVSVYFTINQNPIY